MDLPDTKVELHAFRAYPFHKTICIYADVYDAQSKRHIAVHSPVFEEVGEYQESKPLVTMSEESAQLLFQSLWDMNLRPKSQDGNVGMLAATQDHLADMRRLVAKELKVKLPDDMN